MTEIILFRYHRAYDVCVQTLTLLKRMNPGLDIHGLYGGNDPLDELPTELTDFFASNWLMPLDDPKYKWMHGDLVIRRWFKDHGHTFAFDHIYFTEWDMIFVKPLKDVFPSLEKDVNYSSLFGSYAKAKESGWYWIKQQFGYETKGLLKELKKNGMPVDIESLSFGIMGGAILCRTFLERYAAKPVSSHSNDEVRFSIYSAAFGITLKNNGILDNVDAGKNLFNAENEELFEKDIDHVIAQGGDVIHPIRHVIEGLNEKIG